MADLLLSGDHDIVFVNGECPMTYENGDVVAQRLKIKLLTFLGEWFLDTEVGIPYFQTILNRGVSKSTIDGIFQEAIVEDPLVLEITEFNSIIDVESRSYQLSFKVRTPADFITDFIDITLGV
jgi:hypothetical protein